MDDYDKLKEKVRLVIMSIALRMTWQFHTRELFVDINDDEYLDLLVDILQPLCPGLGVHDVSIKELINPAFIDSEWTDRCF